jgi:histidine ammonia-lyase
MKVEIINDFAKAFGYVCSVCEKEINSKEDLPIVMMDDKYVIHKSCESLYIIQIMHSVWGNDGETKEKKK